MSIHSKIAKSIIVLFVCVLTPCAIAEPKLNGIAVHSELGQQQFIAALFLSTTTDSAEVALLNQEEKRIEVRVLAAQLSMRRFRRMWIEGMAINTSEAEMSAQANNLASFNNMLRVRLFGGDNLSISRSDSATTIAVNGTDIGRIDSPEVFDLLLRTWVGAIPLSSGFRDDLLANGKVRNRTLELFTNTRPSVERINAVASAIEARNSQLASAEEQDSNDEGGVEKRATNTLAAAEVNKPAVAASEPKAKQTSGTTKPAPKPTPTPKLTPKTTPKPKATPTPQKVALAPQPAELDESIFEPDDGSENITAENLLREQLYYKRLAKYTHQYLKYPRKAFERGREGNVRVRVTINRLGKVLETELLQSARYASLNNEAEDAVKRAAPYPAIPDEIDGNEYIFTFQVDFKIAE